MKKILTMIAAAMMILFLVSGAAADRTVVTAIASEVNPDELVSVAVNAEITGYDDGSLTVSLLVPERYRPDEIISLSPGDAIYTQGHEVDIRTITDKDGYLVLNDGEADEVWLFESIDLNYWIMDVDDNTWTTIATIRVPVPERLMFLDEIDPSTGESLLIPTVHNAREFLEIMKDEDDPGFDRHNAMVVFDDRGELAMIRRYYVPWQ